MNPATASPSTLRTVLWWGRGDADYSRNRIVRQAMTALGWSIVDFAPRWSALGSIEAMLRRIRRPALVWVPCFRQRDVASACRWASRRGVPVVFDPLISAYDKQVFERQKIAEDSSQARKLLAWERQLFAQPQAIIADTQPHADYFAQSLGVPRDRLHIIPVGAEANLFEPTPVPPPRQGAIEALFYGSFIHLQGPQVIVQAARQCPSVRWTLLGDGPLHAACVHAAAGLSQVHFEPRIAFEMLPSRIATAHILLGVFSGSDKAGRVVPNKVYQALACGRPVVTRQSDAYPPLPAAWDRQPREACGLFFVAPDDPAALAAQVADLAAHPELLGAHGAAARQWYDRAMSPQSVREAVQRVLAKLVPGTGT